MYDVIQKLEEWDRELLIELGRSGLTPSLEHDLRRKHVQCEFAIEILEFVRYFVKQIRLLR